jgi:hypothetical protein
VNFIFTLLLHRIHKNGYPTKASLNRASLRAYLVANAAFQQVEENLHLPSGDSPIISYVWNIQALGGVSNIAHSSGFFAAPIVPVRIERLGRP